MGFQEVDREYAELKRRYDAGEIRAEEFDAQRERLMVEDDEGYWWAKSKKTGEWMYYDSGDWVPGIPPGYRPPPQKLPAEESTQDRASEPQTRFGQAETAPLEGSPLQGWTAREGPLAEGPEQGERPTSPQQSVRGERLSPPQTAPPLEPQVRTPEGGTRRGGAPRWVLVAAPVALVALVGLVVAAYFLLNRPRPVPDLTGQTKSAAERNAQKDAFKLAFKEDKASSDPKGTILSQDPKPGERVRQGSTIDVVTSAGEETEQASSPESGGSNSYAAGDSTAAAREDAKADAAAKEDAGRTEGELRAAVEDYYEAVDGEDWGYTYDNLDLQTRQRFTRDEWVQKNEYYADNYPLERSSPTINSPASSSVVEVSLAQSFRDGTNQSRPTYFVYEDGSWKHRFSQEEFDLFMADASFEEFAKAKAP
jgi:hypothetical protein